jgi:hypothetical protein
LAELKQIKDVLKGDITVADLISSSSPATGSEEDSEVPSSVASAERDVVARSTVSSHSTGSAGGSAVHTSASITQPTPSPAVVASVSVPIISASSADLLNKLAPRAEPRGGNKSNKALFAGDDIDEHWRPKSPTKDLFNSSQGIFSSSSAASSLFAESTSQPKPPATTDTIPTPSPATPASVDTSPTTPAADSASVPASTPVVSVPEADPLVADPLVAAASASPPAASLSADTALTPPSAPVAVKPELKALFGDSDISAESLFADNVPLRKGPAGATSVKKEKPKPTKNIFTDEDPLA